MKRAVQIGAKLLASYLFAMPFLFVMHVSFHHHNHEVDKSDGALVLMSLEGSDCELCDLYQNQILTLSSIELLSFDGLKYVYINPIFSPESIFYGIEEQQHLRGPPSVIL